MYKKTVKYRNKFRGAVVFFLVNTNIISSYSYCLKQSPTKRALDQAHEYLQKANLNSPKYLWIGKVPSHIFEINLSATWRVAPFPEAQTLLYLGTYIRSHAQQISLISTAVISSPLRCGYHQSKAASMLWYMTWDTSNSWLEHSHTALEMTTWGRLCSLHR